MRDEQEIMDEIKRLSQVNLFDYSKYPEISSIDKEIEAITNTYLKPLYQKKRELQTKIYLREKLSVKQDENINKMNELIKELNEVRVASGKEPEIFVPFGF